LGKIINFEILSIISLRLLINFSLFLIPISVFGFVYPDICKPKIWFEEISGYIGLNNT